MRGAVSLKNFAQVNNVRQWTKRLTQPCIQQMWLSLETNLNSFIRRNDKNNVAGFAWRKSVERRFHILW